MADITENEISRRNQLLFDSDCICGHHYGDHGDGMCILTGGTDCRKCNCRVFRRKEGPVSPAPEGRSEK